MDSKNGNLAWEKSIQLELDQIMSYEVFTVWPNGKPPPPGYKRIPYSLIFNIKFDGCLKSQLVAGGHQSDTVPKEELYSSMVSMEAMRLGFMLSKLNSLSACAGDIGNAFLYGKTREKVYIIAGPKFKELEGRILLINKSLYGLHMLRARFNEHLLVKLARLGFYPTKANLDL